MYRKKIFIENSRGADKILSVYWFAILFIVAAAVSYMVFVFYGKPYDIRESEERALTDKLANCIAEGGYINEELFEGDFSSIKNNFLDNCNINFGTESFSDWDKKGQYYFEIKFYQFNELLSEEFIGNPVFEISRGNINLKPLPVAVGGKYEKDTIVLHYTAGGTFTSDVESVLKNNGLSVHYIIDREGNIAECELDGTQIVECGIKNLAEITGNWENNLAYHAGCGSGKNELPICSDDCVTIAGLLEEDCNVFSPDSELCCIKGFNQKGVGIEIINLGTLCGQDCQDRGEGVEIGGKFWQTYSEQQINALSYLVAGIANRQNITIDRNHIIGHSEITNNKQDPGLAFPWDNFIEKLNEVAEQSSSESIVNQFDLGSGRSFYVLDNQKNPYLVNILSVVGKEDKNE